MFSPVSETLRNLECEGWTLTSVADELGLRLLSVYRWRDGVSAPDNEQAVVDKLRQLSGRTPPPPRLRRWRTAPER